MASKKKISEKRTTQNASKKAKSPEPQPVQAQPFPIVGIGASAGGLEAFRSLLEHLPTDTGMAYVLVQHLDPRHESILAEILSRSTQMPVDEVTDGMRVEPNHVYVIPRNANMSIDNGALRLLPREETRGQHRPIDFFLRSLAEEKSNRAIGVILSGTASDGTLGLEAIKAEGGITFAQDEKTAKYDGMPRSAIVAGCVDFELPPDRIAEELARLSRHPHVATVEAARREERLPSHEELAAGGDVFSQILQLVRMVTGVDFSHYKPNTIRRRMTRRMALLKLDGLSAYADYLHSHKEEVENLFQDILIGVTNFFRDPDIYETLKEKVFPEIVKHRAGDEPMRVWVVGCSTGEEAYSIAIAFLEFTGAKGEHIPIQIFATDINDKAIARARTGIYPQSMITDVSPERLRRFFVKIEGGYQITKPVRDMCVFALQNALTDPPFSRMDLVSCRNLLIYLDVVLQRKVLPALHYSLKPSGFLMLGSSETVGAFTNLFRLEDKKHKIYSKIPGPSHMQFKFVPSVEAVERVEAGRKAIQVAEETAADSAAQREVDRITLQKYSPASVLTDDNWEILLFRGATSVFLEAPSGKVTHNLLKLAREGLLAPLRSALHQAKKHARPVRQEGLSVKFNGHIRDFNLEVMPIKSPTSDDRRFLVFFEPVTPVPELKPTEAGKAEKGRGAKRRPAAKQSDAQLKQELQSTREYLQSVIEQQEAYSEELQSANEEIQSSNEELQSINEELETAKEELQSSNEELATINQELTDSNLEAMQVNNDLINLLSSVQMPIVMLGNDLRIRRFTPMAERLLNLVASDVGRPITDLKLNLDLPQLPELLAEVIDTISARELELKDQKGRWYSLRIRPYKTLENRIEGVVIVMVDVDQLKRAEENLREQYRLIETAYEPIFVWDFDTGIVEWNQGCAKLYGFTRAEAIGRVNHELLRTIGPPALEEFNARLAEKGEWIGELRQKTKDGREVIVESRQQLSEVGGRRLVLETNHDITERKQAEDRLRESEGRFRALADSAPVSIWVDGADAGREFANKAYLDFFGKTLAEAEGFGWQPHVHPDDNERYAGSFLAAFNARAPFHCQARFLNAKGEYRWLDSTALPRFSAAGEFLGYVGAGPDITETKRRELDTQFINQLDLALSQITDAGEIIRSATGKLGEYLGVARCNVSEINLATGLVVVRQDWEGWLNGAPSAAGEFSISDFITPEFCEAVAAGEAAVVNDVTTDPRTRDFTAAYEPFGVSAFIAMPFMNEKRWEASLTVAHSQSRAWRLDETQLIRDVATRLWLTVKRARAMEALRESEEQARRTLAEQMVAGVCECDAAGRFTLVNQRYCDIVGHTKDELMGMRMEDITCPEDWPRNLELYRRLYENGESFFIEKCYLRKDGSEVWVNSHVSPIRSAEGKIEESVAVVVDVTERKRAERELAVAKDRLAADLDAMTRLQKIGAMFMQKGELPAAMEEVVEAAIAISGADKGNIQLFDMTSGKLVIQAQRGFDRPFLDFWSAVKKGMGACGAALESGERVIVEDVTLSPIFAGTPALDVMSQAGVRAVQYTPVMSRSGKLMAVFSTHFATPGRPDERALRLLDLLAHVTTDIIERAQAEKALRSAYEQAEEATRAKDEFLAVVSHELRSPLNSILGYTRLLRAETADAAQIKQLVGIIERNGRMQLQLIEDLLDTARIITGKLELEVQPVDLVAVITAALDVVRPSAQAKGVRLISNLNPLAGQITGDPDRLQQVVWNLLSNAIKFTPENGRVEIILKRMDPHTAIIVRDTGKGIEPEFMPHIFERFRQADMSSLRRAGGLGLGLSLAKHLVELHGGTIEAESAGAGQGAAFIIRLPLRAVYTVAPEERKELAALLPAGAKSLAGVRALIVDDEEEARTLLTMILQNYGAEAVAAPSGKEALELLARQTPDERFDVLICDIGMPNEDGYSVMRKVRKLPPDKGGAIPAVALTAYGRAEDRLRALSAGFQMHVTKPVDPDELSLVILSLLRRGDT